MKTKQHNGNHFTEKEMEPAKDLNTMLIESLQHQVMMLKEKLDDTEAAWIMSSKECAEVAWSLLSIIEGKFESDESILFEEEIHDYINAVSFFSGIDDRIKAHSGIKERLEKLNF